MTGSPRPFVLGARIIAEGAPVFIVAEAGVNHNGDLALAKRLVDVAAEAGADGVKFQTFRSEALVSRAAPKAAYQQAATGADEGQREMLARLELTPDQYAEIREHCARRRILFFSTPFDEASADALEALGVPLFKLPSGEITNLPLLRHVAAKGKPIILSTGMSTLAEVAEAVAAIRAAGDPPLALLHCVSAYPAPPAEMNLRAMDTLRDRFGYPVGLSDHTLGIEVAVAAVARGAVIVEKHFTLDRQLPGPDHPASLEPGELAALIRAIRSVEAALGDGEKRPMPSETDARRVARKSLVAGGPIRAGERLTPSRVRIKRPGTGISPADLPRALGRTVRRDLAADEVIDWEALAEE
ncbi:MAG: N-acetylneuraminate synthase [Candidatus Rokubacteria bacterium]|nr:N-acetylneuraminate synthase [Candidatus Rokubacteria bacterium]